MFRRILSIFFIFTATHAAATPPDTIYIDDRLFGVNDTHLFILRTANDNLGLHIFGMKDTYLVAKNIDTGLDEEIWPVLRQHGAYNHNDNTGDPIASIQSFPLKGAVNPFEILAARGALQIENPREASGVEPYIQLSHADLVVDDFALDADALIAQMEHAVAMTLSAIQPYPDTGFASMTFSTPQSLLGNWTVDLADCGHMGDYQVSPIYGMRVVQLAMIECWDISQEQPAVLYVVMQPVPEVD